ncbi:hypothetical protein KIY87_gp66 [Mycobacterium phage Malec]|uniref:Uncharacterized protein n=1 Tax=Mycobacterium phage Malec TaxID=2500574 RepID=A0A3Q9R8V5_9CAUD|nr:hypothetical protein KIY87_gp66 [Mycobacterium phage Malec]AZV00829.1 hypothetical protein SEA_MALEC_35 [Mycobacterium phage Malec]
MPDLTVPNPSALKAYVEDYERLRGAGSADTNLMLLLADSIVTEVRALGFPDLPPI